MTTAYLMKAGGACAAIALIVVSRAGADHPFPRFGLANQATSVRALIVALVAALIGEAPHPAFAVVAAAAGTLLDGVDGWLARRTRMVSAFGARYDMEIDALLIQVLAVLVWRYGKAGSWVLASGLWRYAFFAAGRVWPWLRRPLAPTVRAKTICVIQIAALLVALLPSIEPATSSVIAAAALAALSYSFLADIGRLWRLSRSDQQAVVSGFAQSVDCSG
jgi:phosphatidylglycerophosphate synthase